MKHILMLFIVMFLCLFYMQAQELLYEGIGKVGEFSHEMVANMLPGQLLPDGRRVALGDVQWSRRKLGLPPLVWDLKEAENADVRTVYIYVDRDYNNSNGSGQIDQRDDTPAEGLKNDYDSGVLYHNDIKSSSIDGDNTAGNEITARTDKEEVIDVQHIDTVITINNYWNVDSPAYSEMEKTHRFYWAIGAFIQAPKQNYFSTGFSIKGGYEFRLDKLSLGLWPEIDVSTGYPYGIEFNFGLSGEFMYESWIGFGVGWFIYQNLFPLIPGGPDDWGSNHYSLQFLRLYFTLVRGSLRLSPYFSFYQDPFWKVNERYNNVKDDLKMAYGFLVELKLPLLKAKKPSEGSLKTE